MDSTSDKEKASNPGNPAGNGKSEKSDTTENMKIRNSTPKNSDEEEGKSLNTTQDLIDQADRMAIDASILDEDDDTADMTITEEREGIKSWAEESAGKSVKLNVFDLDTLFNDELHAVPGRPNKKVKMLREPNDKTKLPPEYPNVWQYARGGATKDEAILMVFKYQNRIKNRRGRQKRREKAKSGVSAGHKPTSQRSPKPSTSSRRNDESTITVDVSSGSESEWETTGRKHKRSTYVARRRAAGYGSEFDTDGGAGNRRKRGRSPSRNERNAKRRDTKVTPKSKLSSNPTKAPPALTDEIILKSFPNMLMVYESFDRKNPITASKFKDLSVEMMNCWMHSKPKAGAPEPRVKGTVFVKDHGVIKCDDPGTAAYFKELLSHPFKCGKFRAWSYDENDGWTDSSVFINDKYSVKLTPNTTTTLINRALAGQGLDNEIVFKRINQVKAGGVVYFRMKSSAAEAVMKEKDNTIPAGLTELQFRFDKPSDAAPVTTSATPSSSKVK